MPMLTLVPVTNDQVTSKSKLDLEAKGYKPIEPEHLLLLLLLLHISDIFGLHGK